MKEVYATNNEVEIQMLVGLLESQGIFAQVHADGAGGYLRVQGADFNIFKRVVVRDEDWSRALSMGDTFCVATLYRAFKRVNMGEE